MPGQNALKVSIQGLPNLKRMFDDIGYALSDRELQGVLARQGREVVKAARRNARFPGRINQQFKQDLAVRRNRITKGKPSVDAGVKFMKTLDDKPSGSRSGNKVAIIAAHITQGFNQTGRETRSGKFRGMVKDQVQNPITTGFRQSQGAIQQATDREVKRLLQKVKRKHANILI